MRKFALTTITILTLLLSATVSFAQNRYTVVPNGNGTYTVTEAPPIISHAPIKPYGLNLQPANVPQRAAPAPTFNAAAAGPGPLIIDNPYYVEPADNQEPPELAAFRNTLLQLFKRIFRIP